MSKCKDYGFKVEWQKQLFTYPETFYELPNDSEHDFSHSLRLVTGHR